MSKAEKAKTATVAFNIIDDNLPIVKLDAVRGQVGRRARLLPPHSVVHVFVLTMLPRAGQGSDALPRFLRQVTRFIQPRPLKSCPCMGRIRRFRRQHPGSKGFGALG